MVSFDIKKFPKVTAKGPLPLSGEFTVMKGGEISSQKNRMLDRKPSGYLLIVKTWPVQQRTTRK